MARPGNQVPLARLATASLPPLSIQRSGRQLGQSLVVIGLVSIVTDWVISTARGIEIQFLEHSSEYPDADGHIERPVPILPTPSVLPAADEC